MSYEIWTRNQYGPQFGRPVDKIESDLTAEQVVAYLKGGHGYLLHQLCVTEETAVMEAGQWLKTYGRTSN